jgi:hypothetical protein
VSQWLGGGEFTVTKSYPTKTVVGLILGLALAVSALLAVAVDRARVVREWGDQVEELRRRNVELFNDNAGLRMQVEIFREQLVQAQAKE